MQCLEYNFDGLVGPTHNFAGLSCGNLASQKHRHFVSSPRQAALQGLKKMKLLMDLGVPQAIIPAQERPDFYFLRQNGFSGKDEDILEKAAKEAPERLAMAYSSSSMWTANAATVSPSIDCEDQHLHMTVANLATLPHRALEPPFTMRFLKSIFLSQNHFTLHEPLENNGIFFDEGAANHMRMCENHSEHGLEIFVYGKESQLSGGIQPKKFPARQSLESSQKIVQMHKLDDQLVLFLQQNPLIIDQGIFHNDVIAISNENVFLYHRLAFVNPDPVRDSIQKIFERISQKKLFLLEVTEEDLTIEEAVESYFFNSQIVSLSDGTMALIAPLTCQKNKRTQELIEKIIAMDNPISQVHYIDVSQSLKNGGGPACLRFRAVLNTEEAKGVNPACFLNDALYKILVHFVSRYYREKLKIRDLQDRAFLRDVRDALNQLSKILKLGNIYSFQQ